MNDEEVKEKYGVDKSIGLMLGIQVILLIIALGLTILGIVRAHDVNRLIVYIGQAFTCVMFIIYILIHFRKRTSVHFKWIVYSYALLEAIRAALLHTENVAEVPGYIARFLLVALACNCILVAERCDDAKSLKITYLIAVLEVMVYIVFLIGFPGVLLGIYNKFLPIVGMLIAGSLSLFQTARVQQMQEE